MQKFQIDAQSGRARTGRLFTAHGEIKTPFFMPVATKGSVKLLSNEEVLSAGTECMISNAFVLSMQPGVQVVENAGGLHRFMGWKKGLFTDSGGFQLLREAFFDSISDKGIVFKNPFDGKKNLFSPEDSISLQNRLGSDVVMCLDDVPQAGAGIERLKESLARTTAWANRCLDAHKNKKQLLFGICQGGTSKKLREKSAVELSALSFDGLAIGGLAIGESKKELFEASKTALAILPEEKPRYLMGVGSAKELVQAISVGVDVFDSAFPTRTARHGMAFGTEKNLNIENGSFKNDFRPLEKDCECFVCRTHSRAYIHHLFKTKEENGQKYLSYHNVFFIQSLMQKIRQSITEGRFEKEFSEMLS